MKKIISYKVVTVMLLLSLVMLFIPGKIKATSTITVEETFTNPDITRYWSKVERIRLNNSNIGQEKFISDNEHKRDNIIKQFGNTARPNSQLFLLHYAEGWDTNQQPVPVLFVHGAGKDGDYAADPIGGENVEGLMQYLKDNGFKVFSITFAHPHGDNYIQREILAAAIQRIKDVTNASKVDIIAHSKGNMSARMYVSNVKKEWGVPFRCDVRRYIQLGAPNGGIDYSFRNTWDAWGIMATGEHGPVPYLNMLIYGVWVDTAYHSLYSLDDGGGAYTGQAQMLAKWDDVYPLDAYEQDWYTTYYGGWGFASYSKGIDYAIEQGGNLIEILKNSPVDSTVEIATLAGNVNVINGITMEDDGPSDGIVFVESALMTEPMTTNGATLLDKELMELNHIELAYHEQAKAWILTQLTR
ncbi:esterase/lipase family protein [Caldisalinibacter kiritimatiensis]|uniref:Putative acetyltransferase and hydrolase n=1 Tax=Caldisalinibacter kiritimatiensis TaxID=1304284 RepID=R1CNP9_9FIRM|nr:Putative acetyltransferase and hydrolase [Caldisalinibacter kiritimatiensis]EOD00326.1 Putative acetyltransferase and hydrolase [Caldisalinibacter kiritimatiensis]